MIARILCRIGAWLDILAEGAGDQPLFWPPACDVWITSLDPTCVPPGDPETILHGTPGPAAVPAGGMSEATP